MDQRKHQEQTDEPFRETFDVFALLVKCLIDIQIRSEYRSAALLSTQLQCAVSDLAKDIDERVRKAIDVTLCGALRTLCMLLS